MTLIDRDGVEKLSVTVGRVVVWRGDLQSARPLIRFAEKVLLPAARADGPVHVLRNQIRFSASEPTSFVGECKKFG